MQITRRFALELLGSVALFPRNLVRWTARNAKGSEAAELADTPSDPYDLIWKTSSQHSAESMPCGGGDVGLNVWVENGQILCYVSRSGTFDELNSFPKLGRLRLRLEPNPFLEGESFTQTLHLRQGFVEIRGKKKDLSVAVQIWVDVYEPVVHFDIVGSSPIAAEIAFETWRLTTRGDSPGEVATHRSYDGAPHAAVHLPDEVSFVGNDVVAYHDNGHYFSAFDLCVEQQGLGGVREQMWNPLQGLCFGTLLRGDNFVQAGTQDGRYASTDFRAWKLRSRTPAPRQSIRAYLHIDNVATSREWLDGALRLAGQYEGTRRGARQRTLAWWNAFWGKSYIRLFPGKPQPEKAEWRVGRNYQLFRYQLGCNAFGKYPTKFNGGLFTFDPEFVRPEIQLDPDFRLWGGGSFTAQNQRMVYWPMLKSGDGELMESQFLFYLRTLRNAELRTEVYWKHGGACFTEQLENFGLPVGYEYGWNRPPGLDPGIQWSRYVDRLWETVLEFCLMILETERFFASDITRYLPMLHSCVSFFDEHAQQQHLVNTGKPLDEQGHLVFFPGTALETYKDTLNSTVTIVALKTLTERLLELPSRYLGSAERTYYAGLLARLPVIPMREKEGHRVIAPAELWDRIQNVEIPQLYPVFPYGAYGLGMPDLPLAVDTWKYGVDTPQQKNYISWHQDAIFCARLGLTEEAAAITLKKLDDAPRRCPTFWGPGHDWVPDHNWGGSGMVGLQEMLLQTVGRKLLLFPAWPASWDVAFKLHAPFSTTVEGLLEHGRLRELVVSPLNRLADVVLPEWIDWVPGRDTHGSAAHSQATESEASGSASVRTMPSSHP